jgi:hypothetical protein
MHRNIDTVYRAASVVFGKIVTYGSISLPGEVGFDNVMGA